MNNIYTRFTLILLAVVLFAMLLTGTALAANEYVVTSVPAGQCSGNRLDTIQNINVGTTLYGTYTITGTGFNASGEYTSLVFSGTGVVVDYQAPAFSFAPNTLITIVDRWYSDVGRSVLVGELSVTFDCTTGLIVGGGASSAAMLFADGRVNQEQWASASAYCRNDSIEVWAIGGDGRGELAFSVAREDIEALGDDLAENTLLGEAEGPRGIISLWRLTTGEFQLMSPGEGGDSTKLYIYIWSGCPQWR
jgi:hypothetical protein